MQEKSMRDFFQTELKSLVIPLVMIILGMLFIILKAGILDVLVTIIGVLMIVAAVALGLTLINKKMDPLTIFGAAIMGVLGIVCVTKAFDVSKFVLTVIGMVIFVNAIIRIFVERTLRGTVSFKKYMLNDVITAVLGLVLLIMPRDSADFFFIAVGVFMLLMGITNIISAYSFYKNGRYVNDGTDVVWEDRPKRIEKIDKK